MSLKMDKLPKKILSWCWKVLRRRLPPGHVLFEEGDLYCQLSSKYLPLEIKEDMNEQRIQQEFPCGFSKCSEAFDTLTKYESHYNMVHRNVCQACHRIYPSAHLLDIHILEAHDSMFALLAEKQNMYQCLLEDCDKKLKTTQERRNHMIKIHQYPANYRYDRHKGKRQTQKQQKNDLKDSSAMETETSSVTDPSLQGSQGSGRVFSYRVPKNISFGQGVSRGFHSGRGRGRGKAQKKHWHNKQKEDKDTTVNIEEVSMTDLSEALS